MRKGTTCHCASFIYTLFYMKLTFYDAMSFMGCSLDISGPETNASRFPEISWQRPPHDIL